MNQKEKILYHQIHPLKLATDIGATFPFLGYLWLHQVVPALLWGFVPPILMSTMLILWSDNLESLKQSKFGRYINLSMTPLVQALRLLTLVPMAYGAWEHKASIVSLGIVLLILCWCYRLGWKKLAQILASTFATLGSIAILLITLGGLFSASGKEPASFNILIIFGLFPVLPISLLSFFKPKMAGIALLVSSAITLCCIYAGATRSPLESTTDPHDYLIGAPIVIIGAMVFGISFLKPKENQKNWVQNEAK
jgi:hypothetical protein